MIKGFSMTFSPEDAAGALREIEAAENRSAQLHGYERSSPQLILWGILWAIGYGLNDLFPSRGGAIWAAIIPIGVIAGFAAVRDAGHRVAWRYGADALTAMAFFAAAFYVLWPVSPKQIAALIPLLVAAAYVTAGIRRGSRYIATGLAVAMLTLIGFGVLREHFFLWMAVIGGAALILAGVWLRRV
jgi:hypothetical protein